MNKNEATTSIRMQSTQLWGVHDQEQSLCRQLIINPRPNEQFKYTNDNNLTKKDRSLIPLSLVIKIVCFGVTNNEPHLLHLLRSFCHWE